MWLLVKRNPDLFRDHASSISQSEDTANTIVVSNVEQDSAQDAESLLQRSERKRAAASGYVRCIAARLVLIKSIRTLKLPVPELVYKTKCEGQEPCRTALDEMEFGLKCFVRAGRAILTHASNPFAAYLTLSMAVTCWEGISAYDQEDKEVSQPEHISKIHTDDMFDSLLLLVDSASQVAISDMRTTLPDKKWTIGSAESILHHLCRLQDFVTSQRLRVITSSGVEPTPDKNVNPLTMQRYLPSLARISYKVIRAPKYDLYVLP